MIFLILTLIILLGIILINEKIEGKFLSKFDTIFITFIGILALQFLFIPTCTIKSPQLYKGVNQNTYELHTLERYIEQVDTNFNYYSVFFIPKKWVNNAYKDIYIKIDTVKPIQRNNENNIKRIKKQDDS